MHTLNVLSLYICICTHMHMCNEYSDILIFICAHLMIVDNSGIKVNRLKMHIIVSFVDIAIFLFHWQKLVKQKSI